MTRKDGSSSGSPGPRYPPPGDGNRVKVLATNIDDGGDGGYKMLDTAGVTGDFGDGGVSGNDVAAIARGDGRGDVSCGEACLLQGVGQQALRELRLLDALIAYAGCQDAAAGVIK